MLCQKWLAKLPRQTKSFGKSFSKSFGNFLKLFFLKMSKSSTANLSNSSAFGDPSSRFKQCVQHAALRTQSSDLAEGHLTKFGAKNFKEFLKCLEILSLDDEEFFEAIISTIDHESPNSTNPQFFHQFLLNFQQLWTEATVAAEQQKAVAISDPVAQGIAAQGISAKKGGSNSSKQILRQMHSEVQRQFGATASHASRFDDDITDARTIAGITVGYSETIGTDRRTQEDTFVIGSGKCDDSKKLPRALQNEFLNLGARIKKFQAGQHPGFTYVGSTAVVSVYSTDQKLTVANCGDSRAVLFVKHPDNRVEFHRLTNDHDPADIFERSRVEALGGEVSIGDGFSSCNRVGAKNNSHLGLAMSRSFGDSSTKNSQKKCLISHEPDIYQYDVKNILNAAGQGAQIFLLSSCDGLYERDLNEATYAQHLQDWFAEKSGGKPPRQDLPALQQKLTPTALNPNKSRSISETVPSCI